MSKRRRWLISKKQVADWLGQAESAMIEENYAEAQRVCERVLKYVPKGSEAYGDAQTYLGAVCGMQQDSEGAYAACTEALTVYPERGDIWYNRGVACMFTSRIGQAVKDFERALALAKTPDEREKCEERLALVTKAAQSEMAERGPDFTLEELIAQEELFREGLAAMAAERWEEGAEIFRRVIDMGEAHPQPWGNLAGCLIMQARFDEAEAALRRALELDPQYDLALQNLRLLPRMRKQGPPPSFAIRDPLAQGPPPVLDIKTLE